MDLTYIFQRETAKLDGSKDDANFLVHQHTDNRYFVVGILTVAETSLGGNTPVVSSNSAMVWDMLRLAGLLVPEKQRELSRCGGGLFQVLLLEKQGPRHPCP